MPFRQLPGAELCHFRKGDVLISAGEVVTHIYYLTKGVVSREIASSSGAEAIITVKRADHWVSALVGLLVLYRKGHISTSNFVAKTNITCYKIPKESYLAVANQDPDILRATIDVLMEDQYRILALYQTKQEGTTASRLCALLLENAQNVDGRECLPAQWSNVELAKVLGVHSVTVAKILRVLKENGCIRRSDDHRLEVLDRALLSQYAERERTLRYRHEQSKNQ